MSYFFLIFIKILFSSQITYFIFSFQGDGGVLHFRFENSYMIFENCINSQNHAASVLYSSIFIQIFLLFIQILKKMLKFIQSSGGTLSINLKNSFVLIIACLFHESTSAMVVNMRLINFLKFFCKYGGSVFLGTTNENVVFDSVLTTKSQSGVVIQK